MKKRRKKNKKRKKQRKINVSKKTLRQGSKEIKNILLSINPTCNICGRKGNLELHHVYLIRHGFKTQQDHCVLLCDRCHKKFHKKFDKYLDRLFSENPHTNFLEIYNKVKYHL